MNGSIRLGDPDNQFYSDFEDTKWETLFQSQIDPIIDTFSCKDIFKAETGIQQHLVHNKIPLQTKMHMPFKHVTSLRLNSFVHRSSCLHAYSLCGEMAFFLNVCLCCLPFFFVDALSSTYTQRAVRLSGRVLGNFKPVTNIYLKLASTVMVVASVGRYSKHRTSGHPTPTMQDINNGGDGVCVVIAPVTRFHADVVRAWCCFFFLFFSFASVFCSSHFVASADRKRERNGGWETVLITQPPPGHYDSSHKHSEHQPRQRGVYVCRILSCAVCMWWAPEEPPHITSI